MLRYEAVNGERRSAITGRPNIATVATFQPLVTNSGPDELAGAPINTIPPTEETDIALAV